MAEQIINNGTFDNDGSAEKIRLAFQKAKEMFAEIYGQIPFEDSDISGQAGKFLKVNAGETAFELDNVPGGGDLLASNNLSDINTASTARTNLGLGTASVADLLDEDTMSSDSATDVPSQQSVKAYVDAQVLDYVAGTGITIQTTSPYTAAAPGIVNTSTANDVQSVTFDRGTRVLTIDLASGNVTVDLTDYTVSKVDGYEITKGSGNTDDDAWEVGDYGVGWDTDTDRYVHFKVNSLPVVTAGVLQDSNLSFATNNPV